eukprot:g3445.t1
MSGEEEHESLLPDSQTREVPLARMAGAPPPLAEQSLEERVVRLNLYCPWPALLQNEDRQLPGSSYRDRSDPDKRTGIQKCLQYRFLPFIVVSVAVSLSVVTVVLTVAFGDTGAHKVRNKDEPVTDWEGRGAPSPHMKEWPFWRFTLSRFLDAHYAFSCASFAVSAVLTFVGMAARHAVIFWPAEDPVRLRAPKEQDAGCGTDAINTGQAQGELERIERNLGNVANKTVRYDSVTTKGESSDVRHSASERGASGSEMSKNTTGGSMSSPSLLAPTPTTASNRREGCCVPTDEIPLCRGIRVANICVLAVGLFGNTFYALIPVIPYMESKRWEDSQFWARPRRDPLTGELQDDHVSFSTFGVVALTGKTTFLYCVLGAAVVVNLLSVGFGIAYGVISSTNNNRHGQGPDWKVQYLSVFFLWLYFIVFTLPAMVTLGSSQGEIRSGSRLT